MSGNPLEQFNNAMAPVNTAVQSARTAWDTFWDVLKMALFAIPILLGGGFLINYLRDQGVEMPDWLNGAVDSVFGFVGDMLGNIPGPIGEFLGGLFARNTNAAVASASEETVRGMLDGVPENLTNLLAQQPFRQQLQTLARNTDGSEIPIQRLLTTQQGLTRMLTTDGGRAAMRQIIGALRRDYPNGLPTEMPEGQGSNLINIPQIQAAFRATLNDSATFNNIWATEDGRALLLDGASLAAGVNFGTDNAALATFLIGADGGVGTSGLGVPAIQQLMTGFMENPSQAVAGLMNNTTVPDAALYNLIQGISVTEGSPLAGTLNDLKAMDQQQFTALRTNVRELGSEMVNAFTQPGGAISALATYASDERLTGARLASLVSLAPSDDIPAPLRPVLNNPTKAQALITLARTLEGNESGSFSRFASLAMQATVEVPELTDDSNRERHDELRRTRDRAVAELLSFMADPAQRDAVNTFLRTVPELAPEAAQGAIAALSPQSREEGEATVRVVTAASNAMSAEQAQQFERGIREAVSSGNYTRLGALLFDDGLRDRLLGDTDTQQDLVRIAAQNRAGMGYNERTVRAFLTGDGTNTRVAFNSALPSALGNGVGTHNLRQLVTLVDAIDDATGDSVRAGTEAEADRRNGRVVNFFMRLASGQVTDAELETRSSDGTTILEDLQRRMTNENVVIAVRDFLHNVDRDNMSPAQQRLIRTLEEKWWIDRDNIGQVDPIAGAISYNDDLGIAPALAGNESLVKLILGQRTFGNWFFGDYLFSRVDDELIPVGEAMEAVSAERGNYRPTAVAVPPVTTPRQRD